MHIYKPSAAISIPTDVNLTELLHTTARPGLLSSHLIAKDSLTDRSLTLGELRKRAGRIAHGLQLRYHPSEQSTWAIIIPNSVEYIEVFHAILWTGGVGCPINHALKATEIAHALTVSKPSFVVAVGDVVPKVKEAIKLAQELAAAQDTTTARWKVKELITVITKSSNLPHIPDDFFEDSPLPIPHYNNTRTRVASIHLSSGTTGHPKGVELTHYNFVANCHQLFAHDPAQFDTNSRTVAFTPFAHIAMTTMPLFLGPWTGMFHHAMPAYNQETFGALVGSNIATSFQGVPSIVLAMAQSDLTTKYDFSHAKVINVGGARLNLEIKARLLSRAPWRLNECYGMTEAAGYVAYQRYGESLPPNTVGYLLPNIEAVLRKDGKDAPRGGPGELWLRGPNITRGYVSNAAATKDAFPEPGWFNTGDVCTFDDQGRLSIVGRTKELVKYKGFQVAPAELESYINDKNGEVVQECAVGAIWDESQLTELPTAWVVLRSHILQQSAKQQRSMLRQIQQSVDSQVSGYKKLRGGVWLIEALPKNATGKVLRKQLSTMCTGLSSLDQRVNKL